MPHLPSAFRSFLFAFSDAAAPDDTIKAKHIARFLIGTEDKAAEASEDWGHLCGINAATDALRRRKAAESRRSAEEAAHNSEIAALRKEIALREEFRAIEAKIRNSSPQGFWQRKIDILWHYMAKGETLTDLAPRFDMTVAMIEKEAQRGRLLFAKHGASEDLMIAIHR